MGTRIISHSILLSSVYVHWGHFGLEDSTLIVLRTIDIKIVTCIYRFHERRWKVNRYSACAEPASKNVFAHFSQVERSADYHLPRDFIILSSTPLAAPIRKLVCIMPEWLA